MDHTGIEILSFATNILLWSSKKTNELNIIAFGDEFSNFSFKNCPSLSTGFHPTKDLVKLHENPSEVFVRCSS